MNRTLIATFFGGVAPASLQEQQVAYGVGQALGGSRFTVQHGGYNGLMEEVARGAAETGGHVVAVTLAGKAEWGALNEYVHESVHAPSMGTRLTHLIERADVVVGMGGGIGTLHELAAAIWYAGNVRSVPIVLVGSTACRLLAFLERERWVYESPTRPLDFLHTVKTLPEFRALLPKVSPQVHPDPNDSASSLEGRIRRAAFVDGAYQLADGTVLTNYFDPFRLAADPVLSADLADAMAVRLHLDPDVIVGMALGGVALASNLARTLGRPLLIARSQPKSYGTFAQLEGAPRRGDRAVLVDDVVRHGRQMLNAARLVAEAGLVASEAICVLDRSQGGKRLLRGQGLTLESILEEPHTDYGPRRDDVTGLVDSPR